MQKKGTMEISKGKRTRGDPPYQKKHLSGAGEHYVPGCMTERAVPRQGVSQTTVGFQAKPMHIAFYWPHSCQNALRQSVYNKANRNFRFQVSTIN